MSPRLRDHISKHQKHPGSRGNAGSRHHHRSILDKCHPGYFGEVSIRRYHLRRSQSFCPTVNFDELRALFSEKTWVNATKKHDWRCPQHGCSVMELGKRSREEKAPKSHVFIYVIASIYFLKGGSYVLFNSVDLGQCFSTLTSH
uniref:Large ribosomal subunit protein uL15 n=1 Tax=Equus caballus TaxID=9796 RepID=A0A3Q2KWU4_HORSE